MLFSGPLAMPLTAAPSSPRDMWDVWDAQVTPPGYEPSSSNPGGVHPRFLQVRVEAKAGLIPGDWKAEFQSFSVATAALRTPHGSFVLFPESGRSPVRR